MNDADKWMMVLVSHTMHLLMQTPDIKQVQQRGKQLTSSHVVLPLLYFHATLSSADAVKFFGLPDEISAGALGFGNFPSILPWSCGCYNPASVQVGVFVFRR